MVINIVCRLIMNAEKPACFLVSSLATDLQAKTRCLGNNSHNNASEAGALKGDMEGAPYAQVLFVNTEVALVNEATK